MRIILAACFLWSIAVSARAQENAFVAPVFSFEFGSPLFINRTPGVFNRFGSTENGTSASRSYGLGAEWRSPSLITPTIGISARTQFSYSTGYFDDSANRFTVSGINRTLDMEGRLLWNVARLSLEAGVWTSFRVHANVYEDSLAGNQTVDITPQNTQSARIHFGLVTGLVIPISDFLLRPEVQARADLTELPRAGFNALTAGISLAYSLGGTSAKPVIPDPIHLPLLSKAFDPQIHFLVHGSERKHELLLDRVETLVKQYAMRDSSGANSSAVAPRVTEWVLESYHVPPITISCTSAPFESGVVTISSEGRALINKEITVANQMHEGLDTTFALDDDLSWQDALGRLNSNASNRLIAEFLVRPSNSGDRTDPQTTVARDTLILPPVDTNHIGSTTRKNQLRFVFSDRDEPGADTARSQLLDLLQTMLRPQERVTILDSETCGNGIHAKVTKSILRRLGVNATIAPRQTRRSTLETEPEWRVPDNAIVAIIER